MEEEKQSESAHPAKKITPLQLREQYSLNIADLAWRARVAPGTVYFMMLGRPIARQQAEQILTTISTIAGQPYTLEEVQVALLPEDEEQGGSAALSS